MPEISRFLGIAVRMDDRDHEPAHLHAQYAEGPNGADFALEFLHARIARGSTGAGAR
jgi:hypothetical protein